MSAARAQLRSNERILEGIYDELEWRTLPDCPEEESLTWAGEESLSEIAARLRRDNKRLKVEIENG